MSRQNPTISVECPCCGARIVIDPNLGKVIRHELPPPKKSGLDLGEAAELLRRQAEEREAVFRQSAADLETHSQLLERKFEESLDQNRGRPVTRPTRDIDLD
jgi:hypothetical protein